MDTLIKLSEVLEVSVSGLLGGRVDGSASAGEIAEQLSRINEQLAIKNRRGRRVWTAVWIALAAIFLIQLLSILMSLLVYPSYSQNSQNGPAVNASDPYTPPEE